VKFLLKILGAKTRNEIRGGKLWEITRLWGKDRMITMVEPAKPAPFVRPQGGKVEGIRTHAIKDQDDVTNLTKKPELL